VDQEERKKKKVRPKIVFQYPPAGWFSKGKEFFSEGVSRTPERKVKQRIFPYLGQFLPRICRGLASYRRTLRFWKEKKEGPLVLNEKDA